MREIVRGDVSLSTLLGGDPCFLCGKYWYGRCALGSELPRYQVQVGKEDDFGG